MEWQRVAELFGGDAVGTHGTGYLIAPGLALTARHVVQNRTDTELRFLTPDAHGLPGTVGDWQKARVAWTGGDDLDLALLVSGEPIKTFGPGPVVRLARLDGRAPVPVDTMGFPEAVSAKTHSDTLQVNALVNAWSGVRSDAMLLAVQSASSTEAVGWQGISGAAVFAGDRLCGVMQKVPAKLDHVLRATPVSGMFEVADSAALLHASGIELSSGLVDADYVARLPRSGNWQAARANYVRAVLDQFCQVDHIGLSLDGTTDVRRDALATYTNRRLRIEPGELRRGDILGSATG